MCGFNPTPETTPYYERCVVQVEITTCTHEDDLGHACIVIDKPFYFAFVNVECYDTEHARPSITQCVSLSPELEKYASIYASQGGFAISSAMGTKYESSLPYTNAPAVSASGAYVSHRKWKSSHEARERLYGDISVAHRWYIIDWLLAPPPPAAALPPPPPSFVPLVPPAPPLSCVLVS